MQKFYDEKLTKIINSIELVTTYAKPLIEQERFHNRYSNDVYYVIFDKNYEPYVLYLEDRKHWESFNYFVYRINKRVQKFQDADKIAHLELDISEKKSRLSYLQVYDKNYLNKKLGSTLINLFDYIAYTKGTKAASGISCTLDSKFISQEKLNAFYEKKGWEVDKLENSYSTYTIAKTFGYDNVLEYAKQFITIKQDNIIFKFNIPDYYKPMVQNALKDTIKKEPCPVIKTENNLMQR